MRTDHAALSWHRRTPEPMPQLARRLMYIEQFDYEVLHRPGTKHGNANGLSRKPVQKDDVDEYKGCSCIFADLGDDDFVDTKENDFSSNDESDGFR